MVTRRELPNPPTPDPDPDPDATGCQNFFARHRWQLVKPLSYAATPVACSDVQCGSNGTLGIGLAPRDPSLGRQQRMVLVCTVAMPMLLCLYFVGYAVSSIVQGAGQTNPSPCHPWPQPSITLPSMAPAIHGPSHPWPEPSCLQPSWRQLECRAKPSIVRPSALG